MVIDLMACLRSSVGIYVSPNYRYHSKYGIPGYAYDKWYRSISVLSQQMVLELMVFVQGSSALDEEENVKWTEFNGGIKMKKITRKFGFVLRSRSMAFGVY